MESGGGGGGSGGDRLPSEEGDVELEDEELEAGPEPGRAHPAEPAFHTTEYELEGACSPLTEKDEEEGFEEEDEEEDNRNIEEEEEEEGEGGSGLEEEEEEDASEEDERMVILTEVNPYILCSICKGYFIDATTITECLHTFCKSCIVRHFYYSNRCPKCNIIVHQTQPLYNIRLDRQLQDIVFRLVPKLEEREKKQIHDFYKERGLEVPKPVMPQPPPAGRMSRPKKSLSTAAVFRIPAELDVSLLLEFIGAEEGTGNFKVLEKKFIRVSGEATIRHVEKFLRRKMELDPACQIDIVCGDHLLEHYQTLRDIQTSLGSSAVQDGLLVLHYGLVLSQVAIT
ncbi:polycomb group RING finger protein 6 [Latimeria chalumnae]|uniref:polycomb group RING finger protein 6 n=1 Tax=Latimeria chalumnae TaxID=7897 RepID=UPI00313BE2FC